MRHAFVALNFIDIYFRTGRYPMALPNGLGSDAVGVVEAVGEGVTDVKAGDRVGYLLGPQGAYSDVRLMPADVLIPLPERRVGPHGLDADDEGHDGAVPVPPGAIRCRAARRSCTTLPPAASAWSPASGHARSA